MLNVCTPGAAVEIKIQSHNCSSQSLWATEVLLYNPNHPVVFIGRFAYARPFPGKRNPNHVPGTREVTAEIVKGHDRLPNKKCLQTKPVQMGPPQTMGNT